MKNANQQLKNYAYLPIEIAEQFVPPTDEQLLDQSFSIFNDNTLNRQSSLEQVIDTKTQELIDAIRTKFNYKVDIHPSMSTYADRWAIRPKNSNLYTAIVWRHGGEDRYEILSLRIRKDRALCSARCTQREEHMVVGIRDVNKAASFVAGLAPYTTKELAPRIVSKMIQEVGNTVIRSRKSINKAFNAFRFRLSNEDMAKQILKVLDAVNRQESADLYEHDKLVHHYNEYVTTRKQLEEEHEYIGELAPMFMFRSVCDNSIQLMGVVAEITSSGEGDADVEERNTYIKSYTCFEDMPVEVQRVVKTMEVSEKTSTPTLGESLVEGVGIAPVPCTTEITLCREACGFVVPKDVLDSFVMEAEELGGL